MNKKLITTDPWIASISRALRRASDRALRLAKATGTPLGVMKNGRIVNLNPDAKGWRKMLRAATEARNGTKEPEVRAKKAKKGDLKRILNKVPNRPPVPGDEME
jgi:hypothetical protein